MRFKEGSQSFHRRYVIYEPLGAGGMAAVYRAKDRLGSDVALKRLVPFATRLAVKRAVSHRPGALFPKRLWDGVNGRADPEQPTALADLAPPLPDTDVDGGALAAAPPETSRARIIVASSAPPAPEQLLDATLEMSASNGSVTLHDLGDPDAELASLDLEPTIAMLEGPLARQGGSSPPKTAADTKHPLFFADEAPRAPVNPFSDSARQLRLALAAEFHTLSSVRHPNIISVLDYGFDADGQPYFTMELLENARTILDAGRGLPQERKIALLEQMLQALLYLHRRRVIHRDLKPGNVLVIDDRVKVLDFGVAVLTEQAREAGSAIAGTPAYMAPELFQGRPASEVSDLYAFGVIAYELLTEQTLFENRDVWLAVADALYKIPDLSPLDPRLAPVIGKLLAKAPKDRFEDVTEVIAALSEAMGQPLRIETAATRESFLSAARLIGRDGELSVLVDVLDQVMEGRGSAWLIGGESGVGKSRLLDELRAQALVAGAAVIRGQEVSEGGGPYELFRDVLRWLVLLADPSDEEASILLPFVPDIPALLGKRVANPPEIAPEGIQERLSSTVEELLRRLQQPAVILLEDLHWSRSDSVKLLARITARTAELPVLFVASYRDDERRELPSVLPSMQLIKLNRLTSVGVAALAESMIGPGSVRPDVLEKLLYETEGNPFFLVEVVRALAERAGQLDRIGQEPLSEHVSSRAMDLVVRRRLQRVPSSARPLLEAAAVAGRRIDLALLRAIDPQVNVDDWLSACTDAAVIDAQEGRTRFAHDKLREGLKSELSEERCRALHRRIARAIEAVYPHHPAHTAALAHHWAAAGDADKAAFCSGLAGEQALQSSAYKEAAEFFEQALAFLPKGRVEAAREGSAPEGVVGRAEEALASMRALSKTLFGAGSIETGRTRLLRARFHGLLAEVHSRLGNHPEGRKHGEEALKELGVPMPETTLARALGLSLEGMLLAVRSLVPSAFVETSDTSRGALAQASRIQNQITETCFYTQDAFTLFFSGLRALNLGESAGPLSEVARMYTLIGLSAGLIPARFLAESWCQRGYELAGSRCKPYELAYILQRNSVYQMTVARWERAEEQLRRGIIISQSSGDRRQWEESSMMLAMVYAYQGRFAEGYRIAAEVTLSALRRGDGQTIFWGAVSQTTTAIRLGRPDGLDRLLGLLPWVKSSAVGPDVMGSAGILSLVYFYRGEHRKAREQAEKALKLLTGKRPVAYWTYDAVAAIAEVFVSLWEAAKDEPLDERASLGKLADQACRELKSFAQIFPFAEPSAWLFRGMYEQIAGRQVKARRDLQKAIAEAERLGMLYPSARAHFELGRRGSGASRKEHLLRAIELFTKMGARPELERAQSELERPGEEAVVTASPPP